MRKSAVKRPLWIENHEGYDILVYINPDGAGSRKIYRVGNKDFSSMKEAKDSLTMERITRDTRKQAEANWEEQVRQGLRELAQDIVNMVDNNARDKYAFKEEFLERVSMDVDAMVKLMEKARDENTGHHFLGALKVKDGGQNA